jgi:hypothetical protein
MWFAGQEVVDRSGQGVGVLEVVLVERKSVGSARRPVARTSSVCNRWA